MTENRAKDLELYIHIPFCVRKCLYCDFVSAPAKEAVQDDYMKALLYEMEKRAKEYEGYRIVSVFIGGGTPSVVKSQWIEALLKSIRAHFTLTEDAEITMEMNPGTVNAKSLARYKEAGINRLSMGLQSADNEELKALGRIHTWEEFEASYLLARKMGFSNINVDIMSAIPGQTLDSYCATLDKVCGLLPPPEHISAYSLIVEEGTPFARMEAEGGLKRADEDTDREMYEETANRLAKRGYVRYEISNYAKEGYACRHNIGYWRRVSYVGFGISAASLVDNVRFQNTSDLEAYIGNPLDCREEYVPLSEKDAMEEFMFLGLRMTKGVSLVEFERQFGLALHEVYGNIVKRNIEDGLLRYDEQCADGDTRLCLTLKGLDLSNYVMAQFLLDS